MFFYYDNEKNIVVTTKKSILESKKKKLYGGDTQQEKKNLIEIPETVQKFYSPKKGHIFEKNETTGKFSKKKVPSIIKPEKKEQVAITKSDCKNKGKLFDPEKKVCVEDTTYNRIIMKNKEKQQRQNTSFAVRRAKKQPIGKRKEEEEDEKKSPIIILTQEEIKRETCISKSNVILREHQLKCVIKMLSQRGIIASFGVGTGKTLTAVACSECLIEKGVVTKVIVSSPKSLLTNFKKELIKYHFYDKEKNETEETTPPPTLPHYEFITHDGIKNKFIEIERDRENNKKNNEDFLLIVDEAHEFRTSLDYTKNENKKGNFFLELALLAKKVLLLTATPFINNEADIINLVNAVKGGNPYMLTEYPKEKTEKEIFFKDTFMFFELPEFEKHESGMPSSEVFIKRFIMTPKYYNQYMQIEKGFNIDWKNPTVFLNGLRQASNVLEGNPKIEWIIDRLVNLKKRTLIYSSYLDSGIKIVQRSLKERGIDFVEITGELDLEDRMKAVEDYNSGSSSIFFITKAGGTGLDLKKTEEVILLESNWNNANEQQIIGRAVRIGSHIDVPEKDRNVVIFKLILAKPALSLQEQEEEENDKKTEFNKGKLYKGSADEIIQFLNENKKEKENEILSELRVYAYE